MKTMLHFENKNNSSVNEFRKTSADSSQHEGLISAPFVALKPKLILAETRSAGVSDPLLYSGPVLQHNQFLLLTGK